MSYARSYVFYGHMVQGKVDAIERLALVFSRLDVLEAHCGWILGKGCKCVDQTETSDDLIRREARAQAYEEIAKEAATWKEDAKLIARECPYNSVGQAAYMGEYDVLTLFEEWLRSESKRIRESK